MLSHAYRLDTEGIMNKLRFFAAPEFAISYAVAAIFLVPCHFYVRRFPAMLDSPDTP
jgi:hypothetical protein